MARKTTTFTATKGRDNGKEFIITEMSAYQIESWAHRLGNAAMKSEIDETKLMTNGAAGLAEMGIIAIVKLLLGLDPSLIEPLKKEMMATVQIVPNPSKPHIKRDIIDEDIEEVSTLLELRKAIIELHIGFFTQDAQ